MATPKIIADFETSLSTAISIGSTSFTLASATDDDGVALPTGKYYLTVDNASNQKEYFVGTLTGTSVASVSSVSRQGVEISGAVRAHRVGASVIMTDFMTYKNYIDETTTAGAPDASTTVKGVVEIATLSQVRAGTGVGETGAILVVSPTELDDMTTQDEKAALAGGGAFGTPSTSNKFLTQDYNASATGAPTVQTFTASGTWTKPTGLKYVVVEVQAPGGGGGGGGNTSGFKGAGGGGGGYSKKKINAATLGATETVTIGAVGAGGSTSGGDGTAGGAASFGAHATTTGGGGGEGSNSNVRGGAGGTGSSGDLNISGSNGRQSDISTNALVGDGGASRLGASVIGREPGSSGTNPGNTGANYGGGGGGGGRYAVGGAGGPGLVIVTEYYS